jgi:hypothetical protein
MDAPPEEQQNERQVPAYVALVRIVAVIGMSAAMAMGLFVLLLPNFILAAVLIACAIPFFVLMRLVERSVEHSAPPE